MPALDGGCATVESQHEERLAFGLFVDVSVLHTVGMGVGGTRVRSPRSGQVGPGNRARFLAPSLAVESASLSDLREQIRSITRAESQAAAARSRVVAEYTRRVGERTTEKTLRDQSGKSTRRSRAEVEVAKSLGDLDDTRRAFEDGDISYGHARIIAKTAERVDIDEGELVDRAREQSVDVFARTARRHEHERSADDGVSKLERQKRSRRAGIRVDPSDGMTVLWGRFDPVTGARIKSILSAKTRELWRSGGREPRPSPAQRVADALADLICEPGRGTRASSRRRRTTLFLVANYDVGSQKIRNATLADGTPVPVAVFRDLACDGKLVPAIFDTRGQPLWVGRSKRLATWAQRMALIARDRGCVGCGADPDWCQAHHVRSWEADGLTDIENMVLLCSRCHSQVHHEGWRVEQTPDGKHVLQPPPAKHRRSRAFDTPGGPPVRRGRPPPG